MTRQKLNKLVQSTGDAAFIIDDGGAIVAWNEAAEELFGRPASQAVGEQCADIIRGLDECGPVCSETCSVRQAVRNCQPVRNFDVHAETATGRQWVNVSVMIVEDRGPDEPYAMHVVRVVDVRKRLEMAMRDFVRVVANGDPGTGLTLPPSRLNAANATLTDREIEVVRLLSQGYNATQIAHRLHVSRTTVSNHIQHAMQKLNAHSRLEAIRRAELAGLI